MRSPLHSPADQVFLHGSKPRTTVQTTHPHDHLRTQRNSGVLQRKTEVSITVRMGSGGRKVRSSRPVPRSAHVSS